MRHAFFQRDAQVIYRLVPFTSSVFAVILSVVPLQVPGLAVSTPAFALMAVYYWTVYRPDLMPPSAIFVIGIVLDVLDGTPYIGLSSLTFLILRSLILVFRGRAANQEFALIWAGFFAAAAVAIGLQWLAICLLSMTPLAARPFTFQVLVTVAVFPIGDYLLAQLQRRLLQRV
jgi:rod shape-determining protein MreD